MSIAKTCQCLWCTLFVVKNVYYNSYINTEYNLYIKRLEHKTVKYFVIILYLTVLCSKHSNLCPFTLYKNLWRLYQSRNILGQRGLM